MRYVEHAPIDALRDHVACYWTMTSLAGEAHRVLPDGCMDLVFELPRGGRVVGAMTRAFVTPPGLGVALFGVRFVPGGAAPLLGTEALAACDRVIDLDDVWGSLGRELEERVVLATTTAARIGAVERTLRPLIGPRVDASDARVRRAVRRLAEGPVAIATVAGELGVTERTLERAFAARVGVRPKLFARIARMQRTVAALDRGEPTWSALAATHGFADQAHLVRELVALTGVTPTRLLRERRAGVMSDSFNPRALARDIVPPASIVAPLPGMSR